MMPKRIQRKRTKGWRMPEGAVYVGRPTKWGNPSRCEGIAAVMVYEYYLCATPRGHGLLSQLNELAGKDLVCWCPLDKPCHADVLLRLANEVKGGEHSVPHTQQQNS